MHCPQDLSKTWKEFAPGPAELFLRKNLEPVDAGLKLRLKEKIELYSSNERIMSLLTLPDKLESKRNIQWAESRRCLINLVESLGENSKWSLSHSDDYSLVLGTGHFKIKGVGVDIERRGRQVSAAAASKFTFLEELKMGLSALDVWVIKEACFKADVSRMATFVTQYKILSFDSKTCKGSVGLGSRQNPFLEFKLINTKDLVVGMVLNFQS